MNELDSTTEPAPPPVRWRRIVLLNLLGALAAFLLWLGASYAQVVHEIEVPLLGVFTLIAFLAAAGESLRGFPAERWQRAAMLGVFVVLEGCVYLLLIFTIGVPIHLALGRGL